MAVTTKTVTEKAKKWPKMARFQPKSRYNGRVMAREISFYQCIWVTKFCSERSQPLCSCLAHVRCQNGKATTLEFAISLLVRGISLVTWKLGKGSKTKWKFLMAFAMKGGSRVPLPFFSKMVFCKNHLESFPDCQNVFCT